MYYLCAPTESGLNQVHAGLSVYDANRESVVHYIQRWLNPRWAIKSPWEASIPCSAGYQEPKLIETNGGASRKEAHGQGIQQPSLKLEEKGHA